MSLVRKINSTYNQVDRNLRILEKEGIITIQHRGRLRMIKLNHENLKTKTLIKALKILDTSTRYQFKETEPLAS
jgi:predicted transcriptional regulator